MSVLIRPSLHALTLAMLACACLLVAQTVNTVLGLSVQPLPTDFVLSRTQAPAPAQDAPTPLSAEKLALYTGLTLGERPRTSPADLSDGARPSQLGLKLLGTMTSMQPGMSLATVYDPSSQRTRTVWQGSSLMGAEVLLIERTRVVLLNDGQVEFLDVSSHPGTPATASLPPPPPAPAGAATGLGASIQQTGTNSYTIDRQDVESALANPTQLFTQARVVPAFNEGVSQGFKLFGMRQDSLFSRLGLQNGDILRSINGFTLDSPTRALEAYNHLRGSSRIELEVERGGQPLRKTYSVQD